jgi:hypothetical protein
MKREKILSNLSADKVAKITGTAKEQQNLERCIRSAVASRPDLFVHKQIKCIKKNGTLYVFTTSPLRMTFVSKRFVPRAAA